MSLTEIFGVSNIITLDFETYYDTEFTLSKMATQSYVEDDRFEVIGVGIKINDQPTQFYIGYNAAEAISGLPSDSVVVAHNAQFDAYILEQYYNKTFAHYFCTMMAANALVNPFTKSSALAKVAPYLGLGEKGKEVHNFKGYRLENFSENDLAAYEVYCIQDVDLTYGLVGKLTLPPSEYRLVDLTVKKFVRPQLELDLAVLYTRLAEAKQEKETALFNAGITDKGDLMSNNKFAQLLEHHGVVPPKKISPTTGKETWAFSKQDKEFLALANSPHKSVRDLVNARLNVKSTQEETRLERFIDIANKTPKFAAPLNYYGAHTGRFSGRDNINVQNLPRGSALRRALKAPQGCKVVAGDLSQIEARMTAYFCGQLDLVKQFADGEDVYSSFATKVYGYPVSKETPSERFVGKTCILGLGYGTGHQKLFDTLTLNPAISVTLLEAQKFVNVYRNSYHKIVETWKQLDEAISLMASGVRTELRCGIRTMKNAIVLPNGMRINYPKLQQSNNGWEYLGKTGMVKLYGAKLLENIIQALARIVISRAELTLASHGYYAALQIHDELAYVIAEDKAEKFSKVLMHVLTQEVDFAKGLPLEAEVAYGDTYYDAK